MTTALFAVVAVFALLNLILFGALVELYRDVKQLRDFTGFVDRPLEIRLGSVRGTAPSRYGLPAELDESPSTLVLFLSEKCGTFRAIAGALGGAAPAGAWIVLETETEERGDEWLRAYGFRRPGSEHADRVLLDVRAAIAGRIGVDTTPAGIFVEAGRFTAGTTVPSARHLFAIAPRTLRLSLPGDLSREEVRHGT